MFQRGARPLCHHLDRPVGAVAHPAPEATLHGDAVHERAEAHPLDDAADFGADPHADINAKDVKVKDYASLDAFPNLILYEGWFDAESAKVELAEKAKSAVSEDETIYTHGQIWKAIAQLTKPGSTVFFFLGASPASGGPLSRGAALVELNPDFPGKKQRKYNIFTVDVDGVKLVGKGQKLWDSDETRKIADWIKERHYKPVR